MGDVREAFAELDTLEQVRVLREYQLLDSKPGDLVMGHLAGNYPDKWHALMEALYR